MRYHISRHPLVESDFERVQDFIAPVASMHIARRIVREIKDRIGGLRDYPNIGTVQSDIRPGLRALLSGDKAMICFTVDDIGRSVRILCVTYAGQDWQTIARDRRDD
jgi:toxin ParE1/3/4